MLGLMDKINIVELLDHPEFIPAVIGWIRQEVAGLPR